MSTALTPPSATRRQKGGHHRVSLQASVAAVCRAGWEKSRVARFVTPAPIKSNAHLEGRFGQTALKPYVLFAGVDRRSSIHLLHC
jgi:hypothetical protein